MSWATDTPPVLSPSRAIPHRRPMAEISRRHQLLEPPDMEVRVPVGTALAPVISPRCTFYVPGAAEKESLVTWVCANRWKTRG